MQRTPGALGSPDSTGERRIAGPLNQGATFAPGAVGAPLPGPCYPASAGELLYREERLRQRLHEMFEVIDGLPLASPGKDRGALYSKLAPKSPGDAGYRAGGDDPRIGGAEIAAALAERGGRKTLEMALKPHGFEPRYRAALATLRGPGGEGVAWPLFGARVWERVSVKYAGLLEGHVVVYVDDDVLAQAIRRGDQTILTSELQVLRQRLDRHAGVTGIEVRDIYATARMPV